MTNTALRKPDGMIICSPCSEAKVLNSGQVDCFLWVQVEFLPQAKECKYVGVLFTKNGRMEHCGHTGALLLNQNKKSSPFSDPSFQLWPTGQEMRRLSSRLYIRDGVLPSVNWRESSALTGCSSASNGGSTGGSGSLSCLVSTHVGATF